MSSKPVSFRLSEEQIDYIDSRYDNRNDVAQAAFAAYFPDWPKYERRVGAPEENENWRGKWRVHIHVANGHCQVARVRRGQTEVASNWEALEDEAVLAVHEQGGSETMSGIYECPEDLAKEAIWDASSGGS
jgi:hypothetical protein